MKKAVASLFAVETDFLMEQILYKEYDRFRESMSQNFTMAVETVKTENPHWREKPVPPRKRHAIARERRRRAP